MRDVRGHSVSPRPPGAGEETFAVASRRVIRFAIGYTVVAVAVSALALAGYAAIRSGAADPTSIGTQASVALGTTVTGLIALVCVIGLLVSVIVWIVSAHRLRPEGPGVLGYVAMTLTLVLLGLAYVVPPRVPSLNAAVLTEVALRVAAAVVLVAGVMLVRSSVRDQTGLEIPARTRTMQVSSDDWNASKWDPDVLDEIDRRRGSENS
jgi:magnesium-transporting ATPase (P-type)